MKSSLSAPEFSKIVKKDRKTIVSWIKRGLIPGKRVGRSYQIPIEEVEIFYNSSAYPLKTWQK
jgi:excisionase family DNA binding protein